MSDLIPFADALKRILADPPTLAQLLREQHPGRFDHLEDQDLEACAVCIEALRRAEARGTRLSPVFVDVLIERVRFVLDLDPVNEPRGRH